MFPVFYPLNDFEPDCRYLSEKGLVRKYALRSERQTHDPYCELNSNGQKIYEELREYEICKELKKFFQLEDKNGNHITISKQEFTELFFERFSFDINPENILEQKIKDTRDKFEINFPTKQFSWKNMTVTPTIKNGDFHYDITINCSCSKVLVDSVNMEDYEPPVYLIECEKCGAQYHIYNFKFYSKISP